MNPALSFGGLVRGLLCLAKIITFTAKSDNRQVSDIINTWPLRQQASGTNLGKRSTRIKKVIKTHLGRYKKPTNNKGYP